MKNPFTPKKFALSCLLIPAFLASCGGQNTSGGATYDGRKFDISLSQDGSLYAVSKKVGNYYSLTVSGNGEGIDYTKKEQVPWNPIAKKINSLTIEEGITSIGDYYFSALTIEQAILPPSVKSAKVHSFAPNTKVFTYGDDLDIPNEVYLYSEAKPTKAGKYFHIQNDKPVVWIIDPVSVLFVGNSFTYYPSDVANPAVPEYFGKLAANLGIEVKVDALTKGSHTLTKYASSSDEMGAQLEAKLNQNQYDYIILQEQSTTPINNYNTFLSAVKALSKKVGEKQNHCKVVLYETWGSPTGIQGTSFSSVTAMEEALREAYEKAGQEIDAKVHYVGKGFSQAYDNRHINVYFSDNRHQNGYGAYLSSAIHLRSLFGVSLEGVSEYCGLDNVSDCKALLEIASSVA